MTSNASHTFDSATLRALASLTRDGLAAFDREARCTLWNRRMEELTGVRAERALGADVRMLLDEESLVDACLRGEKATGQRRALRFGDRVTFHVRARATPLLTDDGETIGGFLAYDDVTPEVVAETLAHQSDERFRTMADHAPVLLWLAQPDGRCTFFNQTWLAFTGRTVEEEYGYGWASGIHFEDFARCIDHYMANFNARRPFTMEYRLRRADGEYRWLLDTGVPYFTPDGSFGGYIGSCVDITHKIDAETERERLLDQANAANRAKDEFLATLSHELKTPLNAILGWSETLVGDDRATGDDHRNGLAAIARNARVQNQLIDDLLDVSRIITGKLRIASDAVDLGTVVTAAIESVQLSLDAKHIALDREDDPTVGPVTGDAGRLQQVVWNLLTNAVRFTPVGGRVTVSIRRRGAEAEIVVQDSGEGIAADFLPFVFDRFRQADSSLRRRHGGLGLGLAIVRHIAELHGGTVAAESEGPGRGATFRIRLPSATISQMAEQAALASPLRADALDGLKILFVDDQEDVRNVVEHVLKRCGATVTSVPQADEALRILSDGWLPDVIVSDIQMPEQSGIDLIGRIRALPPECGSRLPVIALSAHTAEVDRRRAFDAGFQDYVAKPLDARRFIEAISRAAHREAP